MTHDARRSTIELISDAFNEASALLSTEAKLLRAEVNEKINHAVAAIGMMVAAAVFFIGALFLLLQTGVAFLVQWGLSTPVASIIMAVVSGAIGLALFFAGKSALSPDHLKPQRSMNQINRDVAMARDVASNR
jgi:phosphate/sulfate permease